MFALDDAKQRHQEIRGSSRFVDHAGDVEEDETAPARGAKATRSVAVLEEQWQKLEELTAAQLRVISNTDVARAARHRNALLAESYSPQGPSLLDRVGAVLPLASGERHRRRNSDDQQY